MEEKAHKWSTDFDNIQRQCKLIPPKCTYQEFQRKILNFPYPPKSTSTLTEDMCLVAISKAHPFDFYEIRNVFDYCKSIDKTIEIIYTARELSCSLMHALKLHGYKLRQ